MSDERCKRCDLPVANEVAAHRLVMEAVRIDSHWSKIKSDLATKFPGMCTTHTCRPIDWRARAIRAESSLRDLVEAVRGEAELVAGPMSRPIRMSIVRNLRAIADRFAPSGREET